MVEQTNKTLREAENNVEIEGLLLEKEVREGKGQDDINYLSVKLTVEVAENEQHTISLYQKELKKDGDPNGIYTGLRTVADKFKAVSDKGVGRENADHVTINQAKIRMNDYVGQDGQLRSFPKIEATFVNRVEEREPNPRATFDVEMVVASAFPEITKDEEETGRATLKGYIPLYGGRIAPIEFVVTEEGADFVQDNYENGDTVQVWGDIVNFRKESVEKIEGAFGSSNVKKKYTTVREYKITGGDEAYDEDDANAYDIELIKQALNEREAYLEELVNKKKKDKGGKKQGFGGGSTNKKKRDISNDDLPF